MSDLERAVQEARRALRDAEKAKEDAEAAGDAARIDAIFTAHEDLLSRSGGLRRALFELHCPKGDFPYDPDCEACTDWDRTDPFPCPTYVLARDWDEVD